MRLLGENGTFPFCRGCDRLRSWVQDVGCGPNRITIVREEFSNVNYQKTAARSLDRAAVGTPAATRTRAFGSGGRCSIHLSYGGL